MADHAYTPDEEGYEQSLADLEAIEPAQKPAYSKVIVALCLVTVIAYTVTCFAFLWHGKPLNDTLTRLFFLCFGFEFGSLAFIKGREIRYGSGGADRMPHVEAVEETEGGKDAEVSK